MGKTATHSGTCQICGNDQKLPGGVLSKHGYTTRWGFFSGVCNGAHGLPFEKSCDLIERAIVNAKDQKASTEQLLADLQTETSFVWVKVRRTEFFTDFGKEYRRDPVAIEEKVEASDLSVEIEGGGLLCVKYVKAEERANDYSRYTFETVELTTSLNYSDNLDAIIRTANQAKRKEYATLIENLANYIEWQQGRVDTWVEQELTPVGPAHTVHLKAFKYRRDVAACIGSSMGAQRFAGYATEDEAKVTCKKCLKSLAH